MFQVGISKNRHFGFRSFRITSVAVNIFNDLYGEVDMRIASSKAPPNSCQSHNH